MCSSSVVVTAGLPIACQPCRIGPTWCVEAAVGSPRAPNKSAVSYPGRPPVSTPNPPAAVARRPIPTSRPCRRRRRCGGPQKAAGPRRRRPGRAGAPEGRAAAPINPPKYRFGRRRFPLRERIRRCSELTLRYRQRATVLRDLAVLANDGSPSVDAPFHARENFGVVVARGRMLSSVRPDAAGRQPPACMGVRGPGPDHPKRARSTMESSGCPSPVSPTVAPYSPSARPHVLAIVVSLRRHGRSSVDATLD